MAGLSRRLGGICHTAANALHRRKVVRIDAREPLTEAPQGGFNAVIRYLQLLAGLCADDLVNVIDGIDEVYLAGVVPDGAVLCVDCVVSGLAKSALGLGRRLRSLKTFTEKTRDTPALAALTIFKLVICIGPSLAWSTGGRG
jgi:hypothetical protein